jgi:hypothetical protein
MVTTWLDRITDESNFWLSAGKAEESKDYSSAAALYLEDTVACLGRGSRVRAALSCYCAAECLSAVGAAEQADWLYSEAGRIYAGIADHGVSSSIRESLWALQRAYACYVFAGDEAESRRILESYRFLVRRANPFMIHSEWLEMPKVAPRKRQDSGAKQVSLDPRIRRALERFFALREPAVSSKKGRAARPRRAGGSLDEQEGFVSQLG